MNRPPLGNLPQITEDKPEVPVTLAARMAADIVTFLAHMSNQYSFDRESGRRKMVMGLEALVSQMLEKIVAAMNKDIDQATYTAGWDACMKAYGISDDQAKSSEEPGGSGGPAEKAPEAGNPPQD
jgi:hypothetical protein